MVSGKRVICVSWQPGLAITRQALLTKIGLRVVSALGEQEGFDACRERVHLMILGHSVPPDEKRKLIKCFREHSEAPVLSLLSPGQEKLPEATFGVESLNPQELVEAIQKILQN